MVMGSGRAVRSDNPFSFLRGPERKLIALEMEGASVYQAVETIASLGKRALVVKGVSDFGDEDKDDTFREYASEASAIYLFHFIRRYVNQQLMPRLSAVGGSVPTPELPGQDGTNKEQLRQFTEGEIKAALGGNDPLEAQAAFEYLFRNAIDPTVRLIEVLNSLDQEYLSFPVSVRLPRPVGVHGSVLDCEPNRNHSDPSGRRQLFAGVEAAHCFRFLPRDAAGSALANLFKSNDPDVLRCAIEGLGWLGHWEWSHRIKETAFQEDNYLYEKLRIFALHAAMRMLALSNSIDVTNQACTRIEDWIEIIRQRDRLDSGDIGAGHSILTVIANRKSGWI